MRSPRDPRPLAAVLYHRSAFCRDHLPDLAAHRDWLGASSYLVGLRPQSVRNRQKDPPHDWWLRAGAPLRAAFQL